MQGYQPQSVFVADPDKLEILTWVDVNMDWISYVKMNPVNKTNQIPKVWSLKLLECWHGEGWSSSVELASLVFASQGYRLIPRVGGQWETEVRDPEKEKIEPAILLSFKFLICYQHHHDVESHVHMFRMLSVLNKHSCRSGRYREFFPMIVRRG